MSDTNDDISIFVDADACPVKDEIYKVAKRYSLSVTLVANVPFQVPDSRKSWLKSITVVGRLDAADDWIAEHVDDRCIVITADIPLADRCLKSNAHVLDMRGGEFTEDRIGEALASREILAELREQNIVTKGPKPFQQRDRSNFLQRLDQTIQKLKRKRR